MGHGGEEVKPGTVIKTPNWVGKEDCPWET